VVSGTLALDLVSGESPGREETPHITTELAAGDVMVQRGTHHRWRPVGDEPAVLVSVMFGLRDSDRDGSPDSDNPPH
jgi:mannose-6-phosphate isomerase-like protein (cupin superfamily)